MKDGNRKIEKNLPFPFPAGPFTFSLTFRFVFSTKVYWAYQGLGMHFDGRALDICEVLGLIPLIHTRINLGAGVTDSTGINVLTLLMTI